MRIISYNILNGGEGRADPLAEVMLAQNADIICLAEAEDEAVLQRLSQRLSMEFVQAPGNSKASAVLSRWPILETVNHALLRPPISKSLLEVAVADAQGAEWTIGAVHLHAHAGESDEQQREKELAAVLDVFEPHRRTGRKHLLAGDFNANSPIQQIDPRQCKPSTRKELEANGGTIPRRAVQMMLDSGYIDCFQAFDAKWASTAGTFSTQFPGQRVDYVFAFGIDPSAIRSAWVERDRLAKYASDHFPIGIELI